MPRFIKLTTSGQSQSPIWIAVEHIIGLWPYRGGTSINVADGTGEPYHVAETPEEVLQLERDARRKEERAEAAEVAGKYAHVDTSSEKFAEEKD